MKAFLLTLIAASTIFLLLSLGYYRFWFIDKPVLYWNGFLRQSQHPDNAEGIRRARYGLPYTISMKVKEAMEKMGRPGAVCLFEPNGYYRDSLHLELRMPEPAVLYYYTGLRSVWMNSPGVEQANYLVRVEKETVAIQPIRSPEELRVIRARYQKFPVIL